MGPKGRLGLACRRVFPESLLSGVRWAALEVVTCGQGPAEGLRCQMDAVTAKYPHTRALGL